MGRQCGEGYPDGRLMWLLEVQRGLFPEEVVKGLVSSYERLLHTLCSEPANWGEKVPELLPEGATPRPRSSAAPPRAGGGRGGHHRRRANRGARRHGGGGGACGDG